VTRLYVDGAKVGEGRVDRTHAFLFSMDETMDIGCDVGEPVSPDSGPREYNGTFQILTTFDLEKLAGWKHWSAEIKAETQFGGPLLTSTGTISPVNTAAIIPGADGTVFALTAVNLTRLFPIDLQKGNLVAASFGRYNLVHAIEEDRRSSRPAESGVLGSRHVERALVSTDDRWDARSSSPESVRSSLGRRHGFLGWR
jgi:hypothetical protein